MNTNPEHNDELRSLIDAMCENTISQQETARLEQIIASDEYAMETYIQSMWMNDGIERLSSGYGSKIDASHFENENTNPDSLETGDDDMVSTAAQQKIWTDDSNLVDGKKSKRKNSSTDSIKLKMRYAGLAILPAILIGTAVAWIANLGDKPPNGENSNNLASNAFDQKNQNAIQPFVESKKLEREKLADGTIVIARPGAKYIVVQQREIKLEKGDLYLIVAKSDQPFVVKTSDGEVVATGTRFTVSANDKTRAAVAQGQVVMKSTTGTIEVGVGQQGTLMQAQQPTRGPARRLSHLVNWAKDALQQEELLVKVTDQENGLIAIDPYGQEARLTLRQYNVDVYIEDGIARTTIDQTFFNHNPWNTEGTFYFPLPPDASVSRLAMYVAGQLNEGGMVSRQRGQEIYTEILYQRRDPALLEMMEGNMFKMRIFPLEGRQEKRILLSYTQNLNELYGTMKYWFPMDHTQDIAKQLSIRVRVKDGAKQFEPGSSTHDVKLTVDGDDLLMEYSAEDIKPDQDFLLSLLPKKDAVDDEVRVSVCEHEGQNYLSARLLPDLTGEHNPEPRQWIVMNDISASRSKIDILAQRHVLKRLIAEADDDDTVFLMDLNTKARNVSVKPVNVRSVDVKPLLNHRPKRLIGATDIAAGLDAVREVIREHKLTNPHLVYLGDGVATDGEKAISELPRLIPNRCKFVGIGIGKKVDSMFLQEAANRTGGLFTTINPNEDIDWRVFDLIASMNTPRMTNIRVTLLDENGKQMETIAYPSSTVIAAGETLTVTAMCDKKLPSKIRFTGRIGQRPVTKFSTVDKAKTGAKYLPRLWAKLHIDDLLKSGMSNQEEIIALSKAFYVVTPFTSLIVLEDDAMYEQYDVERGRKDHWAKYDAPKTIEVIKEPVDWNRWGWGWGRFEGEDSKIDANTQPKSIQEIVDGIQLRINAPFYLWQDTPQDSRTRLYQICESKLESGSDPSRWLTLWFLLASGQQQAAIEWSRGAATGDSGDAAVAPSSSDSPSSVSFEIPKTRAYYEQMHLYDAWGTQLGKEGRLQPMNLFGNSRGSSSLGISRQLMMRPMQLGAVGQGGIDLATLTPISEFLRLASTVPRSTGLNSKLSVSFNQAVSTRWSRVQRDITKYNSQYGGGQWGGRWNSWNESIDLRSNGIADWNGNGIQEILESFDFEDRDRDTIAQLNGLIPNISKFDEIGDFAGAFRFMPGDFDGAFRFMPIQRQLISASGINSAFEVDFDSGRGFGGGGFGRGFLGGAQVLDSSSLIADQPFFDGRTSRGDRMPMMWKQQNKELPASVFLAAAQHPVQNQPGMAAVLAADHLHKRLTELKSKAVLDKRQRGEKKAIEVAISNMERVGATIESGGMFWGYSGWSYQPRPQSMQPPTVQAYPGYAWTYDLTRYAGGLYSTGTDMIHEVAKQYGSRKPSGKINESTRKLIGESRSNFQPVSIRFYEDGLELHVGPNDQFALTQRNSMYLTEKLICDGTNIHHIYDEIGISARREASDIRLNELRQMVPHMVAPADSLIEFFDVELLERDDETYTLKLTLAEIPESEDELSDEDEVQNETTKANSTEKEIPDIHLIVKVDHQGRIVNREWIVDDEPTLSLSFNYDNEKVEMKWQFGIKSDAENGTASYQARPLTPNDETFSAKLDQHVVFDMPLMKPSFYAKKLAELKGIKDIAKAGQAEKDKPIPLKHGDEAIRLLRHQILGFIQDINSNRWGQGNAAAMPKAIELLKLHERLDQTPHPGDVTLCGSAGAQIMHSPDIRDRLNKHDSIKNLAVFRFYQSRYNWQEQAKSFKDQRGLIGHLANYNAAIHVGQKEQLELFDQNFGDSPLELALACSYQQGFKMDRLLKLNDDPKWSGIALFIASTRCQTPDDKQKVASAYWQWQEELAKKDQQPVLLDSVLRLIKTIDKKNQEKVTKLLAQQFESIRKLDSIPVLLDFAERISSWSETKLGDAVYTLARTKLGIDDKDTEVPLLRRFAYGQSLWAGNRYKPALEQFDLIMESLEEKQIPLSPSFCAAMARLAGQAGEAQESVRLEERALELEQPYLPSAINLSAFRQRYQWLWNQYIAAIGRIGQSDPDREEKIDSLVERATNTWDRWQEVDRDNSALPEQMATFLKSAGRNEEAWEFLSSVIDQKPKDASSYFQVGQWYRSQRDLAKAVRWLGEAPQWDTANPQWLYYYGTALKELGRKSEANVQFNKVINGKWAPGLQNWVDRARNEL